MAIIPFREFERLFDEDFPMMRVPKKILEPAIDVYETEKSVVAELALPGIDPDKIDIQVKDDLLIVKGTTEEKKEVNEENYYRKEIRKGSFSRAIPLPSKVKSEKADATYKDGVLKIEIPKEEPEKEEKGVQIKVKKV